MLWQVQSTKGAQKKGGGEPHQDSKIKKDTLEKGAHWMVAKRLEELQKSHRRKEEEQHGKTPNADTWTKVPDPACEVLSEGQEATL